PPRSPLFPYTTLFRSRGDAGDRPVADHVLDRLEREVRVDGRRAEADEQRHVVHLTGVAGLDDEADARPGLLADEVVVHRIREKRSEEHTSELQSRENL